MSYGSRRNKRSQKTRLRPTPPTMNKSKSAPHGKTEVDWPGSIDDKYVDDIRNRLNVIEQNAVSDDMIRAYLAANDMKQRHAVESLKKTVEWRKGHQMFWNNYRSQNERFQFLSQIRKRGSGIASTFGHTKNGRLIFYEKIGENFNIPLFKEFTQSEFINHVIVWCENLLNAAFANSGKSIHLIAEIPYYQNEEKQQYDNNKDKDKEKDKEKEKEQKKNIPITPQFDDDDHDDDINNHDDDTFDDTFPDTEIYKYKFKKSDIKNNCKYLDVVGIIDWNGVNVDKFIENKPLLIAAEQLLCTHYPHLINRIYHINMPLNFEKIEVALKPSVSPQILTKSIFLESQDTKQRRIDFMKKHGKPSLKRRNMNKYHRKNSNTEKKEEEIATDIGKLDEYAISELLKVVQPSFLPIEYGGDCESSEIFTFVDPIYCDLVGVSSEPDPTGYEEYNTEIEELKLWKQHPLRSAERHTERISVKRGEHYTWQYMAEFDRTLIFGVTFEADGFRGKSIKIIVREETQQKCGYCPMFGDFIVLKDGNLIFQFRNSKGAKRLNLQYKIDKNVFPTHFINKHLPDYHAEERLLQSKTLNIGGKSSHSLRGKPAKTASEYSGSTAISTSPPPDIHSLMVTKSTDNKHNNNHNNNNNDNNNNNNKDDEYYRSKMKRAKSHRNKKSSKTKKKSKKSKPKRAKTPEPHTPVGGQEEY